MEERSETHKALNREKARETAKTKKKIEKEKIKKTKGANKR